MCLVVIVPGVSIRIEFISPNMGTTSLKLEKGTPRASEGDKKKQCSVIRTKRQTPFYIATFTTSRKASGKLFHTYTKQSGPFSMNGVTPEAHASKCDAPHAASPRDTLTTLCGDSNNHLLITPGTLSRIRMDLGRTEAAGRSRRSHILAAT